MTIFRKACQAPLLCHGTNFVDDEELKLLYDMNK